MGSGGGRIGFTGRTGWCGLLLLSLAMGGCSIRQYAGSALADSLAASGDTFASDNDPELIRQALPFALKLSESVLADQPRHRGLLLATSRSFTQYAFAFVQQEAEQTEGRDLARANELKQRARKLYLRARDYGLRGLEVSHPGLGQHLQRDPGAAVRQLKRQDVPLMYWTAAAWGSAITLSKDRPELIVEQPVVEALIDRALALDEAFEDGAIHGFLVSYEPARRGQGTDYAARARRHFQRAVELSGGQSAAPYVALAESVALQQQDRAEFERLLKAALAIDVDAKPAWRLANLIYQRRARWLLGQSDALFVE